MNIVPQKNNKGAVCEKILRALPGWFGIEASIQDYIRAVEDLPMWSACEGDSVVGFVALKRHSGFCAEIYVMGVIPEYHRKGIGEALIYAAQGDARAHGAQLLQVKTLAPEVESAEYASTRRFYTALGFKPIETFPTLWDEHNPCLMMGKVI